MAEFVVARNPDPDSTLPYLVRLPLRSGDVILKVRDVWPRTAKVYCHPTHDWPDEPDIVDRAPIRSIERRGVAVDLMLDRARENRSQFVFTKGRGRDMVFWQSARTAKQARPSVRTPTARAAGHVIDIAVDTRERYPWRFTGQQATITKAALPVGDYAVASPPGEQAVVSPALDGAVRPATGRDVLAVVERKSLPDLVSTISGGKLWLLLAALAEIPHSAIVVEDRYSQVFKLTYQRPITITEALAEAAVRYPSVPIVFAETRPLAQEWAYRFFGAALDHARADTTGRARVQDATPTPRPPATPAMIRAWARRAGLDVAAKGRLRPEIVTAYNKAHPDTPLP